MIVFDLNLTFFANESNGITTFLRLMYYLPGPASSSFRDLDEF